MCILLINNILGSFLLFLIIFQYYSNYKDFLKKKEINNSNISSNNNYKEIKELKEELNKSKKIIEQQKNQINELQNQLNSANNQLYKLQSLQSLIKEKDKEINNLKSQLKNISNININNTYYQSNNLNIDKCVNFISNDQRICFAIPCSGNSIFAEIEEKLYKEYPEYRETNNIFLSEGKEVLRFKTINYNKIGTGKPIMLVKPS